MKTRSNKSAGKHKLLNPMVQLKAYNGINSFFSQALCNQISQSITLQINSL